MFSGRGNDTLEKIEVLVAETLDRSKWRTEEKSWKICLNF